MSEILRVDCSYFSVLFVTGSPGKPQTPAFELDPNGRLVTLVWVDGHSGDYPIYGHRILLKAEGKDALIFSLPVQRHSIALMDVGNALKLYILVFNGMVMALSGKPSCMET